MINYVDTISNNRYSVGMAGNNAQMPKKGQKMKHYEVFVDGDFYGTYEAGNIFYARMKCAHDYGYSLSSFDKICREHGCHVVVTLKV